MEAALDDVMESSSPPPGTAPGAEARKTAQDDWPRSILCKQPSFAAGELQAGAPASARTSRFSIARSASADGRQVEARQHGSRQSKFSADIGSQHLEDFWKEPKEIKGTFVDAAAMKDKVRQNLMRPQWNVVDLYKAHSWWTRIAVSPLFDQVTLIVIFINAVWIGYDTDENHESVLTNARPPFIVAENLFCTFFSFEWLVRFMSFRRKVDCLKDGRFMFDTVMVLMMVLETWVLSLLVLTVYESADSGNSGVLGVFKLLRLTRLVRMARLLRAMPELMIMIKGMIAAIRSVYFTLLLLLIITYVFAITLVQLTQNSPGGDMYFPDVLYGMWMLLVHGCLIDSVQKVTRDLSAEPIYINSLFVTYVLLSHLTVLNMLIGVLCEVVSAVAATEKEEMLVTYVNAKLQKVVSLVDTDSDGTISKVEFEAILANAEAVRCLQDVGVDVIGLVDIADFIFDEEASRSGENDTQELSFAKFMDLVLQLRGTNNATVKDVVDLRKYVRTAVTETIPKSVATELRRFMRPDGTLRSKTMSRTFTNQSMGPSPSTSPREPTHAPSSRSTLSSQPQSQPASRQVTRTLTNVSMATEPNSKELPQEATWQQEVREQELRAKKLRSDFDVQLRANIDDMRTDIRCEFVTSAEQNKSVQANPHHDEPKMITASFVAPLNEPKMTQPQSSVFCEGPTLLLPSKERISRKSHRHMLEPPPFDVPVSGEITGESERIGEGDKVWSEASLPNSRESIQQIPASLSRSQTQTPCFPCAGPGRASAREDSSQVVYEHQEDDLWRSVYALANALCGRLEVLRAMGLHAGLAASASTNSDSPLLASVSLASADSEFCKAASARRCIGGGSTVQKLTLSGGEHAWC